MRIGSWNVNSLKARLSHVIEWLTAQKPDVLLLQELKGTEFPVDTLKAIGYETEYVVQKSYNGVATLSRHPITVLSRNLLGDETDSHARYLEVDIQGLRIINIYLPNGNPIGTDNDRSVIAQGASASYEARLDLNLGPRLKSTTTLKENQCDDSSEPSNE